MDCNNKVAYTKKHTKYFDNCMSPNDNNNINNISIIKHFLKCVGVFVKLYFTVLILSAANWPIAHRL